MPGEAREIHPPFAPLLTEGAVQFFEKLLTPESVVFEWGSGSSSLWLAQRVRYLYTVEHDVGWYAAVVKALTDYGCQARVKTRWIEEDKYAAEIERFPDDHFDLVFIDGLDRTRVACVEAALDKVKPGGWLVLDDGQWPMLRPALRVLKAEGWKPIKAKGYKKGWNGSRLKVSETLFYRRPGP